MQETIYLSRRNLNTLISKLNRRLEGEPTFCSIIKSQNPLVKEFQQTMETVLVIAVEDKEYYDAQKELPGMIHVQDEYSLLIKRFLK